jgi:hypothetical protein
MSSTEVARHEFELLERRVEQLEEQRLRELEERSERSWRHTKWLMYGVLILFVGVAVILWTIQITLAVSGD